MADLAPRPTADELTTRGERTRQTILDVAIERFGRDGYRSTSVAEIARVAGVGGTVSYAYFPSKEALFLAALDADAEALIDEGVRTMLDHAALADWQAGLHSLLTALEDHPLARRVLAGLEPSVADRMGQLPALVELGEAVGRRLKAEQASGGVRPEVDVEVLGRGAVAIILSHLMAAIQFGGEGDDAWRDVLAVIDAAIRPPAG